MANEVKIPILVDIANSVNDLKKLQKAGNDSAKGLADAFSTVGKVASLAVAAFAGSKIIGFLSDAAQESAKAEAELNKLSTALRLAGNGGAEALAGLEAFSEAIQANTTFENDAVIANLAYLQSLTNLNVNGLKVAQQAAVDLSAALGIDLQTATQLVGKAANGEVGAFKRYGIEIAKGATDAETFSNALAKLAQFQGSAAAQTNTFDGALRQNNNAFNDVLKAIGALITKNPALIALIKQTTIAFQLLAEQINKNAPAFSKVVTTIATAAQKVGKYVSETALRILNLKESMELGKLESERMAASFRGQTETVKQLDTQIEALKDSMGISSDATKKLEADLKKLTKTAGDASKPLFNLKDAQLSAEDKKKFTAQLAGGDLSILLGFGPEGSKGLKESEKIIGSIVGLIGQGLKGAQGAVELGSKLVAGIADTLLPGIGAVAGQIFSILAQGPEKTKEFITAFIESIPVIIENVIFALLEAIPLLIEKIPEVIQAFIDRIPEIIQKIIEKLPDIVAALAFAMPRIATELSAALIAKLPEIAVAFITALVKEAPRFVTELVNSIKKSLGGIGGAVQGGAGFIGGAIKSVGKIFGFADGGLVPAGFPNDGFPARLTSGEFVANTDLTKLLTDFLTNQEKQQSVSQPMAVNLQIGEKQLASVFLDMDRNGFRTKQ